MTGSLFQGRYSHGFSAYRRGCRCDECKAILCSQRRDARAGRGPGIPRGQQKHGLWAYKHWACRCDVCRTANTTAARAARRRRREREAA